MPKPERTNPRLRARVEALSREMSRLDGEIRGLARAAEHPDREAAARRLRRLAEEQARPKVTPAPGFAPELAERGAADRLLPPEREAPPSDAPSAPGDADPLALQKGATDSRFASYFVTGGLHAVQPLSQERRVQRNKAIFMLIVAAILLYAVISQLF